MRLYIKHVYAARPHRFSIAQAGEVQSYLALGKPSCAWSSKALYPANSFWSVRRDSGRIRPAYYALAGRA